MSYWFGVIWGYENRASSLLSPWPKKCSPLCDVFTTYQYCRILSRTPQTLAEKFFFYFVCLFVFELRCCPCYRDSFWVCLGALYIESGGTPSIVKWTNQNVVQWAGWCGSSRPNKQRNFGKEMSRKEVRKPGKEVETRWWVTYLDSKRISLAPWR